MTFQNHGAACCLALQELIRPCPMIPVFNLHLSAHSERVTKEAVTSLWCNQYHLHPKLKGSLLSPHPSCLTSWFVSQGSKSNRVKNKARSVLITIINTVLGPLMKAGGAAVGGEWDRVETQWETCTRFC